jgi:hypothetical protein
MKETIDFGAGSAEAALNAVLHAVFNSGQRQEVPTCIQRKSGGVLAHHFKPCEK